MAGNLTQYGAPNQGLGLGFDLANPFTWIQYGVPALLWWKKGALWAIIAFVILYQVGKTEF